MKKPLILLTGSEEICHDISEHIGKSAASCFVTKNHLSYDLIKCKKPLLICIAPDRNENITTDDYSAALEYSRKLLCPLYALCPPEQYSSITAEYENVHVEHASLATFISEVKDSIKLVEDNKGDPLALVKSRLRTMIIMSDNAALASCCENSIHASGTAGKRIILTSSDYENVEKIIKDERKCNAFIFTENLSGSISDGVTEIAGINTDDKAPVLLIGTNKTLVAPEKVSYINVEDGTDNEEAVVISAIRKISR
ncbi:MAG: hypothetical protein IJ416_07655 [Ruminiclostridium sp.]|nr:hypothetical protein [Ruminiclostridium sp.]